MKKTKKEIYDYCMPRAKSILELNFAIQKWQNSDNPKQAIIAFAEFIELWQKFDHESFGWTENSWIEYLEQYDEFYSASSFYLEELFDNEVVRLLEEEDEEYNEKDLPFYNDEY